MTERSVRVHSVALLSISSLPKSGTVTTRCGKDGYYDGGPCDGVAEFCDALGNLFDVAVERRLVTCKNCLKALGPET